jgi:metal-responsive CopG/Arc/MetJ family transcriptional regulator
MRKTRVLTLSIQPAIAREMETFVKKDGMTRSEFLREAVREYIRRRKWEKIRLYAARKAVRLGLRNEEDIERLVDEYRTEQEMVKSGKGSG